MPLAFGAGGLDIVYPPENKNLYDRIAEKGLILAESPLGRQPFAQSFPRRNRIVSGLSAGVAVVEATLRSGSLITARLAGEQGRDVYAVPGHPSDPRAAGPNQLIRDGAVLIRGADDILETLEGFARPFRLEEPPAPFFPQPPPNAIPEDVAQDARAVLLTALSPAPCSVDEILRETGLPLAALQIALLEMELAGRVQRLPGNRVALTGEDS